MENFVITLATGVMLSMVASAHAQVIFKDTFQENHGAQSYMNVQMTGVKPAPINAPGVSWDLASGDGTYEAFITPITPGNLALMSSSACFHNVASAALSLASGATFNKPSVLNISADVSFGGDSTSGCCYLGFYSSLPGKHTSDPEANFTGLRFQKNGNVQLVENGKIATAPGVSYKGTYDPAKPVTLSYTIDTAKGTISNASVSGSSNTYTFATTAFTNAATAFAGIGGKTLGGGQCWAVFSEFQLSGTVPPRTGSQP